jgi:hypothetical protein
LLKVTTFSMYIRFFSLFFLLMMISSVSELISCFKNDGIKPGSCVFASMVFLFCTLFVACSKWQFFKSQFNFTFFRMKYFTEFFRGLRYKWRARAYPFFNLARKYLLVLISVGFYQANSNYTLPIFVIVQTIFFITVTVTLPFSHVKDNVTEICSEFTYTLLAIFVMK